MRRRTLIALLGLGVGLGALAAPQPAAAQDGGEPPRVGFLGNSTAALEANLVGPFRDGLRDLGYVEGENLLIEYRWAEGDYERFPALIADLIAADVDVIVTAGTPATLAVVDSFSILPIGTYATSANFHQPRDTTPDFRVFLFFFVQWLIDLRCVGCRAGSLMTIGSPGGGLGLRRWVGHGGLREALAAAKMRARRPTRHRLWSAQILGTLWTTGVFSYHEAAGRTSMRIRVERVGRGRRRPEVEYIDRPPTWRARPKRSDARDFGPRSLHAHEPHGNAPRLRLPWAVKQSAE